MNNINLFYHPKDRLRLTMEDRSYVTVKPVWAAPLSRPGHHLSLMNGKSEEIMMIESLSDLDRDSQAAVKEELSRRYLTSQIKSILVAKSEFGATYWTVETERGQREFVTQSLQENAQWLTPTHILLIDVDGNRFEITDTEMLDLKSRAHLDRTV